MTHVGLNRDRPAPANDEPFPGDRHARWVAVAVLALINMGVLVAGNRDRERGTLAMNALLLDDPHMTPASPGARRAAALCLSALQKFDGALKQWEIYRSQRPDDPVALLVMGVMARRAGQTALAIDCLKQAEQSPHLAPPCRELSELYQSVGDAQNAREWALQFARRTK